MKTIKIQEDVQIGNILLEKGDVIKVHEQSLKESGYDFDIDDEINDFLLLLERKMIRSEKQFRSDTYKTYDIVMRGLDPEVKEAIEGRIGDYIQYNYGKFDGGLTKCVLIN